VERHLNGVVANAKAIGGFRGAQPLDLSQHEDRAVSLRQSFDRRLRVPCVSR
jgi:hypothetical protein